MGHRQIKHNDKHPRAAEVVKIVEMSSGSRLDCYGGYPDDWMILGDLVILATVSHKDEPRLIIKEVDEFIEENREWLEEYENEGEDDPA
jgi:hypothetical protein